VIGDVLAGLAFALVLAAVVVWFRLAMAVRLPANRSGFVAAWLGGGLLGILGLALGAGAITGTAAALAIAVGCFLSFTVAISRQEVGDDAIDVGARLPDASAPDENGTPFALASTAGRPVLLKFFRGHW
jgi:hypothetical protein